MLHLGHRYVLWSTLCDSGCYPTESKMFAINVHDMISVSHLSGQSVILVRVSVVQTGARILEVGSVHPRHLSVSILNEDIDNNL